MKHIEQTTLIKLVAGELSGDQRRDIEAHLASCDECRAALERQRTVYDVLGDWRLGAVALDQWPAVERRLEDWRPVIIRPIWAQVGRVSRIAAAVIVGVGAGYVGGRLATPNVTPTPTFETISDEDALDAVGFAVIESPSATGLFTTVLDLASDAAEQGGAS
jgi:anti-sigma factor RsiW